ncbi:MAG TPA: hydroxymethylglutaryl-CoA lyase [Chloroflexota bacterium]|nr:hydroxymethylglutaryl-CoA lyase [Chloroflexota bacterium]
MMASTGRPTKVSIVEVAPRDGLQNEQSQVPSVAKVRFIDMLSAAGCQMVEATSFVKLDIVPQLADADEVFPVIRKAPGAHYPVLVPTLRGLERALAVDAKEIALVTAASESFANANLHRTVADSLVDVRNLVSEARRARLWVRVYVSVAFVCPFEGRIIPDRVRSICEQLLQVGPDEICLADTVGAATPREVELLLDALLSLAPPEMWAMHFHDTRGTALANVMTSLAHGIHIFDSAAGGLGGCPFAGPGALGNLATEDLVYLLDGLGISHGIDLERLMDASRFISRAIGHPLPSRVFRAGGKPKTIRVTTR